MIEATTALTPLHYVYLISIMKFPSLVWCILGLTMFLFSLFLWPSPSAAFVGAVVLPLVVKAGLNPLTSVTAMTLSTAAAP